VEHEVMRRRAVSE